MESKRLLHSAPLSSCQMLSEMLLDKMFPPLNIISGRLWKKWESLLLVQKRISVIHMPQSGGVNPRLGNCRKLWLEEKNFSITHVPVDLRTRKRSKRKLFDAKNFSWNERKKESEGFCSFSQQVQISELRHPWSKKSKKEALRFSAASKFYIPVIYEYTAAVNKKVR
jgi:hypothetical protein